MDTQLITIPLLVGFNGAHIEQVESPMNLDSKPASTFVASLGDQTWASPMFKFGRQSVRN
jgi:ABC-type sugar transport system ATPase subunit